MNKRLKEKVKEALSSVLPITVIVLTLSMTIVPMPSGMLLLFLAGAAMLIVGMGLFSLGADISMMPMGSGIGAQLTQSRKLSLLVICSFVMGVIITMAEPDLQVLAKQVPAIPDRTIILTVGVGVGIFFVIAALRTLFGIPLARLLWGFYILVFLLAAIAPSDFLAVAFDSGGVTTGPITVPFIMALGIGMVSVRSDGRAQDDNFGFVALCSIGPILAVLLLSILYRPSTANYEPFSAVEVETSADVARALAEQTPEYLREVAVALLPLIAFFLIFQLVFRAFRGRQLGRIGVGFGYTFVGLVLFLTGANVGFMAAGSYIGSHLAATSYRWILVPLGMLIGYFIVAAEPAVHVLNRQVEEISSGVITQKAMQNSLSIGVAIALGIAMLRVLTGISVLWFIVPGYTLALLLTFRVPKIFTAIAFDSGGVASGPMTATFVLPFAMGACESLGGNVLTDAFGVVALVAMTPLITIQMLGLSYDRKRRKAEAESAPSGAAAEELIDYEEAEEDAR